MEQARGKSVAVGRADGRMAVRGALPCNTRFCPNCAPIIQAKRREEIAECVVAARDAGWATLFLTLTIGHDSGDRLDVLLDSLFACWKALAHGGFWSRLKRRHGLRHHVRVVEVQQGGEHGWHPHLHVLLFVDHAAGSDYDPEALGESLTAEWARIAQTSGLRASRHAQRLVEPTEEHLDLMSGYFTKQLAEGLAWEMTGEATKQSRGTSRNPATLLWDAVQGDEEAQRAWRELEEAAHGRQLIGYSAHCRRDLRLEPAVTVEQAIAAATDAQPFEPVVEVHGKDWEEHASRAGFRSDLAVVVATAIEPEEVLWWLHDRGVRASLPGSRPPAETRPPEVGPPDKPWLALP